MKTAKTLLAGLLLLGNIAASGMAQAADGVIFKDELTAGSYCHMKFPAIEGRSLDSNNPVLKSSTSRDIIDFYGSCDENPVGQDQVQAQKLDREHRWETQND
jgi:hypothetical protein